MNFCGTSALSRGVLKPAACAALALTLLSQPASAAMVRFEGFDYDIQFYGLGASFSDILSPGAAPANSPPIKGTPWWGNGDLAGELAAEYLAQIGVDGSPFTEGETIVTEIRFAFEEDADADPETVTYSLVNEGAQNLGIPDFAAFTTTSAESASDPAEPEDATYAYAASVTPVPLPPAGLALGAALLGLLGLRRWKTAIRTA